MRQARSIRAAPLVIMPSSDFDEDDVVHIDDDDGGTDSDADICDRCNCSRGDHEEGTSACTRCGKCRKFKEP